MHTTEHPSRVRLAGIIGPVLFTATFLVQEAFRRATYDPLAEPVSALEVGPYGWIQQLNFVIFGVLTIGHALGQHAGMRPTRGGVAGPLLLGITGVGAVVSGAFPLYDDPAGITQFPPGHLAGGLTFFLISPLALIALSVRMRHDPDWHRLAGYTLACGLALVSIDAFTLGFVLPEGAALHDWAGLVQRLTILLMLFPARIVMAMRLVTTSRRKPPHRVLPHTHSPGSGLTSAVPWHQLAESAPGTFGRGMSHGRCRRGCGRGG